VASRGLSDIDPAIADNVAFRENNELLFGALARASGAELIIDASKGPIRLARLLRDTRLTLNVVHITRPFADYAFSHKKKYNIGLREIVWKFSDYLSLLRKSAVAREAAVFAVLRFEDFLANPEPLRRSLLEMVAGLDSADLANREHSNAGFHSVGGNKNVRFSPEPLSRGRSAVRYEQFSVHQRIALRMLDIVAEVFRPRSTIIERDA
jgi:hypothetical protein